MSHATQIFALLLGLAFVYVGNSHRALTPQKPDQAYLTKHGPALGYAILGLGAGVVAGALVGLAI